MSQSVLHDVTVPIILYNDIQLPCTMHAPVMVIQGSNISISITDNGIFSTSIKTELMDEMPVSKKDVRS